MYIYHCGDVSGEVPPVLIPNTEVKPSYTDSTVPATAWEDRQLPDPKETVERLFLFLLPVDCGCADLMIRIDKSHCIKYNFSQQSE